MDKEFWAKADRYHDEQRAKQLAEDRRRGGAYAEFAEAVEAARAIVKDNELLPVRDEFGAFKYSVPQGLMAACHAREDAAATLLLQRAILRRVVAVERLCWLCIAGLGYLAYRLS